MKRLVAWLQDENGQGITEFALIAGLVTLIVIVALMALGPKIAAVYDKVADSIPAFSHSNNSGNGNHGNGNNGNHNGGNHGSGG